MIGNCGVLGCDWRELTWWEYSVRLALHNEAHVTGSEAEPDYDRIRKMMVH